MKTRLETKSLWRVGLFGLLATLLALPVQAQENEEEEEESRIIVTGSRISRLDVEGPSPVYTITREDIQARGVQQLSDLIRELPLNSGVQEADAVASFAGDSSQVNLRGLGVNGTLVLLNGRRMAPHAFGTSGGDNFVDLNSIPASAIERVEILKDGASAIYGSDALAGVINFILRPDYEGIETSFQVGNTEETDATTVTLDATMGSSSNRGSYMVMVNYYRRNATDLIDRDMSRTADKTRFGGSDERSYFSYPGQFWATDFSVNFQGDGTAADAAAYTPYNYNEIITAIPEAKRYGFYTEADYMVTDTITAFAELSLQRNFAYSEFAPAPAAAVNIPNDNPFNPTNPNNGSYYVAGLVDNTANPDGIDLLGYFRPMDPGNREFETTTTYTRALAGLNGEIGFSWKWEAYYLFARSDVNDVTRNLLILDLWEDAIANTTESTAINPFADRINQNNNAALYDTVKGTDTRNSYLYLSQFGIGAGGDVWDLPAGPIGLYVGAEYREEEIEDLPSIASSQGQLVGSGGTSSAGSRDGAALFAEVSIPVLSKLEVQLAGRYEDYSDFGDSTIPKVGVKFRPIDALLLRASYSEGFKAPSMPQAYGGQTVGFPAARPDAILVDITGDTDFGANRQFESITGGNPGLAPEESEYINFGLVFTGPSDSLLDGLTVGVDYWKLDATNQITTRSVNQTLADEYDYYLDDPAGFIAMSPAARAAITSVVREPNRTYTDAGGNTVTGPGAIDGLNSFFLNLDSVDIEINYTYESENYGSFTFDNFFVYMESYDDGGGNDVGTWALPKYQSNHRLGWTRGDWRANVNVRWVDGFDTIFGIPEELSEVATYDVNVGYDGFWDTRITIGVDNVFDEEAPFSDDDNSAYEPGFHTAAYLGRFWWMAVSRSW